MHAIHHDRLHPLGRTGEGGSTGRFFGDLKSSKVADSPLARRFEARSQYDLTRRAYGGGILQDWFAHLTELALALSLSFAPDPQFRAFHSDDRCRLREDAAVAFTIRLW